MNPTKKTTKQVAKPAKTPGRLGRPTLSTEGLLDKALDLFLEEGFERTSIDAIAAAAGMAKRTIYSRYADKESLFLAALERAIEEWMVPNEQLQAAESDDLEVMLQEVARILVTNIMKPAGLRLMRITNAESGRMPEIGAYTYQHGTERTVAYLADLFQRRFAPSTAALDDWNEAAIAFLYLVVCGPPTMTAWGMTLDEATINSHTQYCVRLFLYGMLPRSQSQPLQPESSQTAPNGEPKSPSTLEGDAVLQESDDLKELQNENRRLKNLLLASMLEVASLKEQREEF